MKLPKRNQVLLGLILIAIIFAFLPEEVTLPVRRQVMPLGSLLRGTAESILITVHRALPAPPDEKEESVDARVRELQLQTVAYENRLEELQAILDDLIGIQDLLDKDFASYHPVPARILIRHDLAQIAQTVEIDVGTNDGVARGMPVVRGTTVLGVIEKSGNSTSTVRLITDARFRAAAMGMTSRVQGILCGQGTRILNVRFVSADIPMTSGEIVLTSGMDSIFPKGFLLGTITLIQDPDQNKELDFEIEPALRFADLEHAVVLRPPR